MRNMTDRYGKTCASLNARCKRSSASFMVAVVAGIAGLRLSCAKSKGYANPTYPDVSGIEGFSLFVKTKDTGFPIKNVGNDR